MDLRIYTLSCRSVFSKSQILQPGRFAAALPVIAAEFISQGEIATNAFVKKSTRLTGANGGIVRMVPRSLPHFLKSERRNTAIFNKTGFATIRRRLQLKRQPRCRSLWIQV